MKSRLVIFGLLTAMLTHNNAALAENMPKGFVSTGESKANGTMLLSSTVATEEVDFTEYAYSGNAFVELCKEYKEKFTQAEVSSIALYASAHLLNDATLTAADEKDIIKGSENINAVNDVMDELYGSDYQQQNVLFPLSSVFAKNENEMKTLKFAELQLQRIVGKDKEQAKKSVLKLKELGIGLAQNKPVDLRDGENKEILYTITPDLGPGAKRVLAEYICAGGAKAAQLKYITNNDSKEYNKISETLIDIANNEFYQIIKPYNIKNAEQQR